MCGRYTLTADANELAAHFGLDGVPAWTPRFNIAPTQEVAVLRAIPGLGLHGDLVRWGLVPGWAKDLRIGNRLINARADTVAEKPAFRSAFHHRRCLIPADGFYEWRQVGPRRKQPYWIGFEGRTLFAFAGLWEHWQDRESGQTVESCTIITTEANSAVAPIHGRMPVILAHQDQAPWLDPDANPTDLSALLAPVAATDMIAYPVSRNVNNPRNDEAELLAPVEPD